jgi:hypothetical protein
MHFKIAKRYAQIVFCLFKCGKQRLGTDVFTCWSEVKFGFDDGGEEVENRKRIRRLSKDLLQLLDQALTGENKKKQTVIKEAEKHHAGEMFRFYAAIADWELQYRVDKYVCRFYKYILVKLTCLFVVNHTENERGCWQTS